MSHEPVGLEGHPAMQDIHGAIAALPSWVEERLAAARRRAEASGPDEAGLLEWARERDATLRAATNDVRSCPCSGPAGDLPACPCAMREVIPVDGRWTRVAEGPDGLETETLSVVGHPPGWNQAEGVRFPRTFGPTGPQQG